MQNEYINAVKDGDLTKVKQLISKGINFEFVESNNWNSIMWSSASGNLDLVKYLKELGVPVTHQDKNGFNALMFAAQRGHLDIVKFLIENGLDINSKTSYDQTALLGAAEENHTEVVLYLLEKGANPRAVNCYKKNSYVLAQMNKNKEMMDIVSKFGGGPRINQHKKKLTDDELSKNQKFHELTTFITNKNLLKIKEIIDNGFDINTKNKNSITPLMIACDKKDNNEIIEYLLSKGADFSLRDNKGISAFYRIVENGNLFLTRLLLNRGANPNLKTNKGETPLLIAVKNGYTDIVYLLIQRKADVNIKTNDKNNPLWWASYRGYTEIIKIMLDNYQGVLINNIDGYNPLHIAVSEKRFDIAKLLLDNKADINLRDKTSRTPLIASVETNNVTMVKLLLNYNPDFSLTNINGETAYEIAFKKGYNEIIELLKDNGDNGKLKSDFKLSQIEEDKKNKIQKETKLPVENEIDVFKNKFLGEKYNFYFDRFLESFFGDPYMAWHDGLDIDSLMKLEGEYRDEAERLLMQSTDYRGAVGLGALKSKKSVLSLKQKLKFVSGKELVDVCSALNDIEQTTDYCKYIIKVLKKDNFWSNRMEGAISLSKYNTKEVIDALYEAILDDEYLVRYHACNSLLKLHGKNEEINEIETIFKKIIGPDNEQIITNADKEKYKNAQTGLMHYLK